MILRGLSASSFPTQGARCAAWRGVTRPNRISRMAGRSPPWQRLSENSPARLGSARPGLQSECDPGSAALCVRGRYKKRGSFSRAPEAASSSR